MSHEVRPAAEDIDLQTLGRALWRTKGWILSLAIGAGVITFIALSMMRPLFTSEARILIQNDESAFTRPAGQGLDLQARTLDEQTVQSQVQVLSSRDLAVSVIEALGLIDNPDFAKDAGTGLVTRLLHRMGLAKGSPKSEEEKAANTFADHLSVFQLSKSSMIAVEYSSGDANLAAAVANKLADVYIDWQRAAKLEQTKDATAWLSAQIEVLRKKVGEAEAAAEQFRTSQGLFAGSNNVTLNAQQLSELNSQLILSKAQRSEAEARARLIQKMLEEKSDIDATSDVLKSELITRLIDQRVQVQRQLAELSATLLPSHPRIKQLSSELADVRVQIRDEAAKIVKSLENEAEIAAAREASLRNSLNDVKTQASGLSEAEIKLRALEREAKAQRDLLESYLARYRDASARHDIGAVPAQATIVSRAHASIKPSFPKKVPISLLAAVATALLSLAYVLARELVTAPPVARETALSALPRGRRRRRSAPAEPAVLPAAVKAASAEAPTAAQAELASASTADAAPQNANRASSHSPGSHTRTGLLQRARGTASPGASGQHATPAPVEGWLDRIRGARRAKEAESRDDGATPIAKGGTMPGLRTNDLRHYLNQRLANAGAEAANDTSPKDRSPAPKPGSDMIGPVLKSLDAVVDHILAVGRGGAPRAVLVAAASAKVDAAREAIAIARALVARQDRIVLIDLARGASAVSAPLEMPRAPGLTDLTTGRAGFEDVVRVDATTALQVIPAGNPKLASADENERFADIFEALTQVYDCVVLHADREAMRRFAPALRFELPAVVAVLPAGAGGGKPDLAGFSAFGCPVAIYEQDGKAPRLKLLKRLASV
jgi:uncharacterized protein involved in exopolysaccharide biosynthesis/Mrp family chromosome partitioning ATPase